MLTLLKQFDGTVNITALYMCISTPQSNDDGLVCLQAEQQKKAAVISAEGDSLAAELLAKAFGDCSEGLVELRKLEAAEDIAYQLSRSRNVVYLPQGQQTLLSLPQ